LHSSKQQLKNNLIKLRTQEVSEVTTRSASSINSQNGEAGEKGSILGRFEKAKATTFNQDQDL
jgi:hypothetical protein